MEQEHLEMILEDINGKFDLILEGHAALERKMDAGFEELSGRIDQNTFAISILNQKIDDVAADLRAHRADTEVHRGYRVRED